MLRRTNNLTSLRVPGVGSGEDEAILKFGDCFALPHKSPQVLAKTFTILRKVS